VRKLSNEILEQHKSEFGVDFTYNKKILDKISIIRSKGLKNEIAGFITRFIKREIRAKKEKEELEKQFSDENVDSITAQEQPKSPIENTETSEETQADVAPDEQSQETVAAETNNDTSEEATN